jgi:excisionase family DNA binding protein
VRDVARALGVSRFTVYDLIKRGDLAAYRVGNRLRIEPQAVAGYKRASGRGGVAPAAAPAAESALTVRDVAGQITRLTPATLRAYETTTVSATRLGAQSFTQHRYTGVALHTLLVATGAARPVAAWRAALRHFVLAVGRDGHAAVVALGEIDPAYGNVPVLVAWERNGAPLPAGEGPLLLVVPSDHRGGRYVRQLTQLLVGDGAAGA